MRRRDLQRWLPALAIMALLAYSSHQSEWPEAARGQPDWLLHGIAYGALGAACYWATSRGTFRRGAAAALLVATGYGAVDELHQSFVPGRDASAGDVLADAVGAALAVALLTFARLWGVWEDPHDPADPQRRRSP